MTRSCNALAMVRCGQRLATSLGPAAASPLPLLPGLRPTQTVCEPCRNCSQGLSDYQIPEGKRNDRQTTTRRLRFDSWLASVDGIFGRRRPSRTWLV